MSLVLLLAILLTAPGCYLGHVASGQLRLLRARQPLEEVLSDPTTPAELRDRLTTVQEARRFADELGLEVGGQYTSYVPWPGDRVITSVVATRPGEVEPAGFWFPLVGRVPYKGYFDQDRAAAEARRLRNEGYDVCEVAVPAYSTLGWFDDPVTGPMVERDEGSLVETVIHELVHATVYVPDHADFNEGVASFIGQEGSIAFFAGEGRAEDAHRERRRIEDSRLVRGVLLRLRQEVEELYAAEPEGEVRDAARREAERRARETVAALPLRAGAESTAELAQSLRLNDACLALTGTYSADLANYGRALAALDGDLRAFVTRLRAASKTPDPRLALLMEEAGSAD